MYIERRSCGIYGRLQLHPCNSSSLTRSCLMCNDDQSNDDSVLPLQPLLPNGRHANAFYYIVDTQASERFTELTTFLCAHSVYIYACSHDDCFEWSGVNTSAAEKGPADIWLRIMKLFRVPYFRGNPQRVSAVPI